MILEAQDRASKDVEDVNRALDELATAATVDAATIEAATRRIDEDFADMTAASESLNKSSGDVGDAVDRMAGRWVDANGRMHDATGKFVSATDDDFAQWEKELDNAGAAAEGWRGRVSSALDSVRNKASDLGRTLSHVGSGNSLPNLAQHLAGIANQLGNVTGKAQLMALGIVAAAGPVAAVLGLIPLALAGIGIAAEKSNTQVKSAFSSMATSVKSTLASAFAPLVPVLVGIAGQVTATVRSLAPAFRQAATALAPILSGLATNLLGVVHTLVSGLAPLVSRVAPVINALGAGLNHVVSGVVGLLGKLNFSAAAQGLGMLLSAVGRLLPLIGELLNALIPVGDTILSDVLPVVLQLAQMLVAMLVPALDAIRPVLGPIISIIAEVAQTIAALLQAALPLVAPILKIVAAFANMDTGLEKIAPLFGALARAIAPLLPIIAKVADLLVGFLNQAFTELAAAIVPLIPPLGQLVSAILTALMQVLQALMPGLNAIIQAFVAMLPVITPLLPVLTQIVQAVTPLLVLLAKLASLVIGPLMQAMSLSIGLMAKFAAAFLGQGVNAVKDFVSMVTSLIANVLRVIKGIVEFVSGVFTGNWREAWNGIKDIVGGVLHIIGSLVSGIVDIGKDLISGLWKGIEAAGSWLFGKIKGLGSSIVGAFKGALKIFSPSQVMADEVGSYIPAGIAKGITDNMHLVTGAAQAVANRAVGSARIGITAGLSGGGLSTLGGGGAGANVQIVFQGNQMMNDASMDTFVRKAGPAITRSLAQAGIKVGM